MNQENEHVSENWSFTTRSIHVGNKPDFLRAVRKSGRAAPPWL